MDKKVRNAQQRILSLISGHSGTFALTGGTALELYYLHHRFSSDLDFFSPKYNIKEIEGLISSFEKGMGKKITFENEFRTPGFARVRFYTLPVEKNRPLKMDFVEDVVFDSPDIKRFKRVPVYDVNQIYIQKILTVTGIHLKIDGTGREVTVGRRTARDAFDIYTLSKKVCPLHKFLHRLPREYQRGVVQWYHSFSRQELKMDLLDLDIYDKKFDSSKMIRYIDDEMKKFIGGVLE